MIESFLNYKYRHYYLGTYLSSTRGAIYKARYLRAKQIEEIGYSKVREVIEHPKVIMAEEVEQSCLTFSPDDIPLKRIAPFTLVLSILQPQEQAANA